MEDTFLDRAALNSYHVARRANFEVCRGADQRAICTHDCALYTQDVYERHVLASRFAPGTVVRMAKTGTCIPEIQQMRVRAGHDARDWVGFDPNLVVIGHDQITNSDFTDGLLPGLRENKLFTMCTIGA